MKVYFQNNKREGGKNQKFFSQLLNNLQTFAVYSLRLYSRQTIGGGEGVECCCQMKRVRRGRVSYLVRQKQRESMGDVKYMRRKGRRTEILAYQGRLKGKK